MLTVVVLLALTSALGLGVVDGLTAAWTSRKGSRGSSIDPPSRVWP